MDILFKIIFVLNSICLPLGVWIMDLLSLGRKDIGSISDFVKLGRKHLYLMLAILISGNFIQLIFSFYLYYNNKFPIFILFGVLAGIIGIIACCITVNINYNAHTGLTIIAISLYTLSILFSSILIGNIPMIIIATIQFLSIFIGFLSHIRTKHLEVFYFTLFGIWNLLVIINFLK